MMAYIKRKQDFRTILSAEVVSFNVALDSVYDDTGTITLLGTEVTYGCEGSFLIMGDHIWLIQTLTPGDHTTDVTVVSILAAFSRKLIWDGTAVPTCVRMEQAFNTQFKSVGDTAYRMPYLQIRNMASTDTQLAPDVEDGLWSLKSFIRKTWRLANIRVSFTFDTQNLYVDIETVQKPSRTIIFGDGHHQLQSQAFSRDSVAKITTLQEGRVMDWYLSSDGQITNTPPTNRAEGTWQVMPLMEADNAPAVVADTFSQNTNSHKIEWYSDQPYQLRDSVRILLDGKVLTSYVSYIGIMSTDSRYYYKSGELATTLTERIKGGTL